MTPNVLTQTEAARIKGCTRQAIHAAMSRGHLTPVPMGAQTLVARDAAFDAFVVSDVGGRAHRSYRMKQEAEAPDSPAANTPPGCPPR